MRGILNEPLYIYIYKATVQIGYSPRYDVPYLPVHSRAKINARPLRGSRSRRLRIFPARAASLITKSPLRGEVFARMPKINPPPPQFRRLALVEASLVADVGVLYLVQVRFSS